jgi:hypothetical protein
MQNGKWNLPAIGLSRRRWQAGVQDEKWLRKILQFEFCI